MDSLSTHKERQANHGGHMHILRVHTKHAMRIEASLFETQPVPEVAMLA